MKKIDRNELITILEKSLKVHGPRINNIRNVGNARVALTEVEAYVGDNNALIIFQRMFHGGESID